MVKGKHGLQARQSRGNLSELSKLLRCFSPLSSRPNLPDGGHDFPVKRHPFKIGSSLIVIPERGRLSAYQIIGLFEITPSLSLMGGLS